MGGKFTVFTLFYFVFEGSFPSTSPWGACNWRGNLTEGFLRYRIGGLIFGGAYTWSGLFSEFYSTCMERKKLAEMLLSMNNFFRCADPIDRLLIIAFCTAALCEILTTVQLCTIIMCIYI